MKRDTPISHEPARVRRFFVTLARIFGACILGACILGMNSLSGPSLAAVDCERWNDRSYFAEATLTDVKQCLSAGADVNARDENGLTPLHVAVSIDDADTALFQILINAGAR